MRGGGLLADGGCGAGEGGTGRVLLRRLGDGVAAIGGRESSRGRNGGIARSSSAYVGGGGDMVAGITPWGELESWVFVGCAVAW